MTPSTGKQIKNFVVVVILSDMGKETMQTLQKIATKAQADEQSWHSQISCHLRLSTVKDATLEHFSMIIKFYQSV